MMINQEHSVGPQRRQWLVMTAGVLAASSCCILPLVLFGLGVGGAWIGGLAQLDPYQHYLVVVTITLLAAGYWFAYRASKRDCAVQACPCPLPKRSARTGLFIATLLVIAAFRVDLFLSVLLRLLRARFRLLPRWRHHDS